MRSRDDSIWSRRRALQAWAAAAGVALWPHVAHGQEQPALFDADVGLDAGHSPADIGASGAGVGEYRHTLDVALRVKPLLEAARVSVNLSRVEHAPLSAMSHPDATERTRIEQAARIAAVGRVKIYVSIHFNGGPPGLRGSETYFNRDNAGFESARLADGLQRHVVAQLRELGHPVVDRGVKEDLSAGKPYGHFFSLRGGMPSALVEALFLSNPPEAELLLRDQAREAIARGYVGGILEYLAAGGSPAVTP